MGGGPAPLDTGFSIPPVCVAPPQALPCSSSRECVPGPCVSPPGATPERREATARSSRWVLPVDARLPSTSLQAPVVCTAGLSRG